MYKRSEYQVIKRRLEERRRFIQVVMGARQIGKSTVVKQVLKDIDIPYQFFSADNVPATNSAWISNCWAAVRSLKESKKLESIILVIDEIQKISNWSEVVKKEWDDDTFYDRDIKVLLLGSSRVLLEKGLSESLAGRFEEIRMGHWSYQEMRECFGYSLDQYIFYGGYPGAAVLMLICKYLGYIFLVKSGILTKLMRWICRVGSLSLPKRRKACSDLGAPSICCPFFNLFRSTNQQNVCSKF